MAAVLVEEDKAAKDTKDVSPSNSKASKQTAEGKNTEVASTPAVAVEGKTGDGAEASVNATTAKGAEKDGNAEKPTTLGRTITAPDNRDVARVLAAFMTALAVIPVVGLVVCERFLRSFVLDDTRRWMFSGAFAVVLVNVVLISYVLYCFYVEGFPDAPAIASASEDEPCKSDLVSAAESGGPAIQAGDDGVAAAVAAHEPKKDR
eukprot:TRINITY_DN64936_c0_g1_i1.p1 TRINITY_DN64936_c0_g1~~TRINITY_DN64936_c0_g1_i1.p1  ORF type:complete len:205 (-),score=37.11 TRINITY_DN64936_c0_g1_i1:244-858(-)